MSQPTPPLNNTKPNYSRHFIFGQAFWWREVKFDANELNYPIKIETKSFGELTMR